MNVNKGILVDQGRFDRRTTTGGPHLMTEIVVRIQISKLPFFEILFPFGNPAPPN